MNENNSVHLDREKLMAEKAKSTLFPVSYENAVYNIAITAGIPKTSNLMKKLKAKREFGFKKYGEKSFQGSFENAISTPSDLDLLEELVDVLNYSLHLSFQNIFEGPNFSSKQKEISEILEDAILLYNKVEKLSDTYRKEENKID